MGVSKKKAKKIASVLSSNLSLDNVKEWEEFERTKLFTDPPEFWTELEKTLCDYTMRIEMNIRKELSKILEVEL